MIKYSCSILLMLFMSYVKAQDTTIVYLKDSINPRGFKLYTGNGFTYFEDEARKDLSTDKTVKPGLYNLEYKNRLVAKVNHLSKNENIIYYYNNDSIVTKVEYKPYFEVTFSKNYYECRTPDYQMNSVHIYDHRIWLVDFYYLYGEFHIRALNKKESDSFRLINLERVKE